MNINKYSDLTCLLVCKLKPLHIYWETYYLLYFEANNLLKIWPTIFFLQMRNVRPCKYSRPCIKQSLTHLSPVLQLYRNQLNDLQCKPIKIFRKTLVPESFISRLTFLNHVRGERPCQISIKELFARIANNV